MIVRIDPELATPLYEQIASAIEVEVSKGRLVPGDGLPAARHLAAALDVNMHTVLKAYQRLQAAGFIEVRRGRSGAVVARSAPPVDGEPDSGLSLMIDALVKRAKEDGIPRKRLLERIGESW